VRKRWRWLGLLVLLLVACNDTKQPSGFVILRADHHTGSSAYPLAANPDRVGSYPADSKSGAGYFYDELLEYRVWVHPDKGAERLNGDKDYCLAFAQYEPAEAFSKKTPGSEPPIVLVRQLEWIDEPERGHFVPEKGERITEWQVQWLPNAKRNAQSIGDFMKNPKEAGP
jgi:hypothetical protein